jgi:hypothetical protein
MATTAKRSNRQGALRSRTDARHISSANSIVQSLTRREHSSQNLGVLVQQLYGYECTMSGMVLSVTVASNDVSRPTMLSWIFVQLSRRQPRGAVRLYINPGGIF